MTKGHRCPRCGSGTRKNRNQVELPYIGGGGRHVSHRIVVCPDEWHTLIRWRREGLCDDPGYHGMRPDTRHPKLSTCRNWRPA